VVEALEALRLLSGTLHARPDLAVAGDVLSEGSPLRAETPDAGLAWDEALDQTHLAEILGTAAPATARAADPASVEAGLGQLNRYLNRAWFRAGVPPQYHDDSTQAVYVALLQNLGRDRFDTLLSDVGRSGVRDVLSRDTADGPAFFRAVDTVKKRAQRERAFQPIDAVDVASPAPGEDALGLWRSALQEAIDQSLTPREAALIYQTLMGKTPSEIALSWGIAPKTVSNEKTRVIQKLRVALEAEIADD
jgi:DNA-binding CsgD family transcriptional regulator